MLIRTHSRGTHDPSFGCHFGSEGFHCSMPAQIARKILGGDAVEPTDPSFESAMVGVHVVDVMFGRLRPRVSGCGQDVDFEFGATRERRDGRPSIAAKVCGRSDRAAQRHGRQAPCIRAFAEPRVDKEKPPPRLPPWSPAQGSDKRSRGRRRYNSQRGRTIAWIDCVPRLECYRRTSTTRLVVRSITTTMAPSTIRISYRRFGKPSSSILTDDGT